MTSPLVVSVNLSNTPRREVLLFFSILQMQNLMIRVIKSWAQGHGASFLSALPLAPHHMPPLALNPWGAIMDTAIIVLLQQ